MYCCAPGSEDFRRIVLAGIGMRVTRVARADCREITMMAMSKMTKTPNAMLSQSTADDGESDGLGVGESADGLGVGESVDGLGAGG